MAIDVTPKDPLRHASFVAEVRGADLRRPVPADVFDKIEAAFNQYAILIFPDQPVTDDEQIAFSSLFGPVKTVTNYHRANAKRRIGDKLSDISNIGADGTILPSDHERRMHSRANQLWHTDNTFKYVPSRCSLLSARVLPPEGGDTEFADARAAYDALPEERKAEIEGLVAEHSIFHSRKKMGFTGYSEGARKELPPVPQVLVRCNPVTGRKALYIASHASHIVGWPKEKGQRLIEELLAFATQPKFVYRHHWRPHDLIIWDNRCTLHRATPYDDMAHRRVLHRATVSDEINSVERVERERAQGTAA